MTDRLSPHATILLIEVNVGNVVKANIAHAPQTRANTGVSHIRFALMLALPLYCL